MPNFSFPLIINDDLTLTIKMNVVIKDKKKLIDCYAYLIEGVLIVEIVFSIIDIPKLDIIKNTDIYCYLEKFMSINIKEYIFIHQFTNFNNDRELSEKYKGLGKKCIKECLKHCVKLYCYNIENVPIILECSGYIPNGKDRYIELTTFSKLELLELFNKYNITGKKDFGDYLNDNKIKNTDLETQSKEELLKNFSQLIVDYESNQELSEYYSRNFKLEILDDSNIYYKTMGCILKDFLNE